MTPEVAPNALKKAVRAILFVLLLAAGVSYAGRRFLPCGTEALSGTCYQQGADGYDVLFAGNSLVMHAVLPLELYEEYGFWSYNLGTGGQSLPESKYLIEDGIRRFHPKLVVLDCTQLIVGEAVQRIAFLHYLTDHMPAFDILRLKMIADLGNRMGYTAGEKAELYFPLTVYHARWEELRNPTDFLRLPADPKKDTGGAKLTAKVRDPDKTSAGSSAAVPPVPDSAAQTLREIIDLCSESGTGLCLISVPLSSEEAVGETSYKRRRNAALYAKETAAESGIRMLDLMEPGALRGLDGDLHFADAYHMNTYGAEIYTKELGRLLTSIYTLPDHRGEPDCAYMEDMLDRYRSEKERCLGDAAAAP